MSTPFEVATNSPWYGQFLQPVVDEVRRLNPATVLDIGAGTGALARLLAPALPGVSLTGTDINQDYLKIARSGNGHPNVHFVKTDASGRLPFDDAAYDVVTVCSVLFLIPNAARAVLLGEIGRVMRPGGRLLVLTPAGRSRFGETLIETFSFPKGSRWTYILWKLLTANAARQWRTAQQLAVWSQTENWNYTSTQVFRKNATLEVIAKPNIKQ
jgi:ubiquinone/menaquinone biosynthesis C-methylase UbiE